MKSFSPPVLTAHAGSHSGLGLFDIGVFAGRVTLCLALGRSADSERLISHILDFLAPVDLIDVGNIDTSVLIIGVVGSEPEETPARTKL